MTDTACDQCGKPLCRDVVRKGRCRFAGVKTVDECHGGGSCSPAPADEAEPGRGTATLKWQQGDRVTRPIFMDDGTWVREGDTCLQRSPRRHGTVVDHYLNGHCEPVFMVEWDDARGITFDYFWHGLERESQPAPPPAAEPVLTFDPKAGLNAHAAAYFDSPIGDRSEHPIAAARREFNAEPVCERCGSRRCPLPTDECPICFALANGTVRCHGHQAEPPISKSVAKRIAAQKWEAAPSRERDRLKVPCGTCGKLPCDRYGDHSDYDAPCGDADTNFTTYCHGGPHEYKPVTPAPPPASRADGGVSAAPRVVDSLTGLIEQMTEVRHWAGCYGQSDAVGITEQGADTIVLALRVLRVLRAKPRKAAAFAQSSGEIAIDLPNVADFFVPLDDAERILGYVAGHGEGGKP